MMHARLGGVLAVMLLVTAPGASSAQVLSAKDGPIVYGHHHLNVGNIEEHKKFWIEALGGVPANVEGFPGDVVKFPGVLVMLRQQKPTGGTKGTSVSNIGFQVPNLQAMVARLSKMGYPSMMQSATANMPVPSAMVMGPDQIAIEIDENKGQAQPISLHHVQLFTPDVAATQAWYVKVFGARPGKSGALEAAGLPGVTLRFAKSEGPVTTTTGAALDHLGFEIDNLKAFVDALEAKGVKPSRPYAAFGAFKLGFTFITDPWGTSIELNEGLDRIFP